MNILWIVLILAYIIGIVFTGIKAKDWKNDFMVKVVASLFWPFTLIFYIIHYFHNKNK